MEDKVEGEGAKVEECCEEAPVLFIINMQTYGQVVEGAR